MTTLRIRGPARLAGTTTLPPDKSILHRALILAALGRGEAHVAAPVRGADNLATLRALRALGVDLRSDAGGVHVVGIEHPKHLRAPDAPIDCANSGTTMRVLAGVLAAASGRFVLDGDASLRRRPMERLRPLERMGARLTPRAEPDGAFEARAARPAASPLTAPFAIDGATLTGATHVLPVASAQLKTALLLAGLYADGATTVIEPSPSRDHTERLLLGVGAAIEREDPTTTTVRAGAPWSHARYDVAPDFSAAAFLLTAAVLTNSPDVALDTGLNPTRSGLLDALVAMGAILAIHPRADVTFEPTGRLAVDDLFDGRLRPTTIDGQLLVRAIDEVPLLGALATRADGETRIADAAELRVKESDRLASTVQLLRAFGAEADETEEGFVVRGPARLRATRVLATPDHRIAMTAAVLGLAAEGTTEIEGFEVADVSYPGFAQALKDLGADVEIV